MMGRGGPRAGALKVVLGDLVLVGESCVGWSIRGFDAMLLGFEMWRRAGLVSLLPVAGRSCCGRMSKWPTRGHIPGAFSRRPAGV